MTRTHVRSFGLKGKSRAQRYVENGAVFVEWWVGPKGGRTRRREKVAERNTKEARDAADAALHRAVALAQHENTGLQSATLTVSELLARYLADAARRPNLRSGERLRPDTLRLYREQRILLLRFVDGETLAAELRRGAVRTAMGAMRDAGLAEGTIGRAVTMLKSAYRWAVAEVEILSANPVDGVKVSTPRSGLLYSRDELRKLLDGLYREPNRREWRFRVLVSLEAAYGARVSQALNLLWTDVDLDAGTLTFRRAARGSKGQADRVVPLLTLARKAIVEAQNHRNEASPWVLWHWRDATKHVRLDAMYQGLHRLEERTGVPHVKHRGFHAFRRSLGTMIAEELGTKQAADWLHDTPEVTARTYVIQGSETHAATSAVLEKILGVA